MCTTARVLSALALASPSLALQVPSNQDPSVLAASSQTERESGCALLDFAARERQLLESDVESCSVSHAHGKGGVEHMALIHRPDKNMRDEQMVVWIAGFPRSGSSTLLSLVSATIDNNRDPNHVFSVFEPCHDEDSYVKNEDPTQEEIAEYCPDLLWGLSRCNFDGVKDLWGWRDPHSSNNYTSFSADTASELCEEADIVAFKTVDFGHNVSKWEWLLDGHANMKVLNIARDPRGIFASWKVLEPFATLVKNGNFYTMTEVCENFANNIRFKDDRVHTVVFEELMENPKPTSKAAYKFLGLPWTKKQHDWIEGVFERSWCPPPPPGMEGFTDCHVASGKEVAEKWHAVLSKEEKQEFLANEDCRLVAETYGYPLDEVDSKEEQSATAEAEKAL